MAYSSLEVANKFISLINSQTTPDQMKIHKLVYIAHGWNLAINNKPLVSDKPRAWDGGPVFLNIWHHIKQYGFGKNNLLTDSETKEPYYRDFTGNERALVEKVFEVYGHMNGQKLSDLTHEIGTPWYKTYFNDGRNQELSDADIKEHYVGVAKSNKAA